MLWDIAHQRGLRLPTKDFNKFKYLVTFSESKPYEEYLKMFDLPELIQSSPTAMLKGVETAVSGAYRSSNIQLIEVRFNPMFRVSKGVMDMDYIIMYAIHGMERAMLRYPIKAGLIIEMDRRLSYRENEIIVQKAIKYKNRGVVGVDLAGPVELNENSKKFKPKMLKDLFVEARKAGLGLTFHTGEATGTDEVWEVVEEIKPDRIGHGLAMKQDEALMKKVASAGIVLENCPTSNLNTRTVASYAEMKEYFDAFKNYGVKFTINTDGPEPFQINLREEYRRLLENGVLSEAELLACNETARKASFINRSSV
jgi:adenosine deaminase